MKETTKGVFNSRTRYTLQEIERKWGKKGERVIFFYSISRNKEEVLVTELYYTVYRII